MALFSESFRQEISKLVRQRHQQLSMALGEPSRAEGTEPPAEESPLLHDLELLIAIANGEQMRTKASKVELHRVEKALKNLLDLLLGNAMQTPINIPDDFWQSKAGILVSRVRWWLSADELITMSNAAVLAFGENTQANRMRIARAMDRGLLEWVPDPSVANPQQNRRVLRSQVERLREQSTLPE